MLDNVVYLWLRIQVDEEEDYYDGPDDSDDESIDSNGISFSYSTFPHHYPLMQNCKWLKISLLLLVIAENNPLNEYPDEISEEDEEDSESESEQERGDSSNESSDEGIEHRGFSKVDADPLYDEDFDENEGGDNYDDEDLRWSYR